jgi:hypothetical protein
MVGTKSLAQRQSQLAQPSIPIRILTPPARFAQRRSRAMRPLRSTVPGRQPPSAGGHLHHLTGNAHDLANRGQEWKRRQGWRRHNELAYTLSQKGLMRMWHAPHLPREAVVKCLNHRHLREHALCKCRNRRWLRDPHRVLTGVSQGHLRPSAVCVPELASHPKPPQSRDMKPQQSMLGMDSS